MSEFQAKTCELIQRLPEDKVKLVFALLFQTALNGDDFESDLAYFKSIPGYLESLDAAASTPWEECLDESEVKWSYLS